jgi:hypothetical protein
MGGPRVLSYGWDPELYDVPGQPQHNQAHHLAAFIIAGIDDVTYKGQNRADIESYVLDRIVQPSSQDERLSKKGIEIGRKLKTNTYDIQQLGKAIYQQIKS